MNEKEILKMLNNMKVTEIKSLISLSIEYLIGMYGAKFRNIIKDIKDIHKQLNKRKKGLKR